MGTAEVTGSVPWLGGSWGHPQDWGIPRVGAPLSRCIQAARVGGQCPLSPPTHPRLVSPHCPKCPLCSMGIPGSAATPSPAHSLGQVGVRGDPKTGRVVLAPNGL